MTDCLGRCAGMTSQERYKGCLYDCNDQYKRCLAAERRRC